MDLTPPAATAVSINHPIIKEAKEHPNLIDATASQEVAEEAVGIPSKSATSFWSPTGIIGVIVIALVLCGFLTFNYLSGMFSELRTTETLTPTDFPKPTQIAAVGTAEPTFTPTSVPTPLGGGSGRIAFTSNRNEPAPDTCGANCNYDIYIMNVDGSQQTRLTKIVASDFNPVWQPAER